MKTITCVGLLSISVMVACQSSPDSTTKIQKQDTATVSRQTIETTTDSTNLIIPGKQAGRLYLGQDMQEVFKLLGNADDGDAAMGSALGIWYKKDSLKGKSSPTVIFSSYRDSNMVVKVAKQISVSDPKLKTADGVATGISLKALLNTYPNLKISALYLKDKTKDSLKVYDDQKHGVAFDIQNDTCKAIVIHPKNKPVNSTYLDFHPGWKPVYSQPAG